MADTETAITGNPISTWADLAAAITAEPDLDPKYPLAIRAERILYARAEVLRVQETYEQQKKDAVAFYERKLEQCKQGLGFILEKLNNLVAQTDDKKLVTPKGTIFYVTRDAHTWPDDETLLTWAKEKKLNCVRTKEYVDKRVALEYIKSTNDAPPGFVTSPDTKLQVRE